MSSVINGKCKYCGHDASAPNFAYHFCRGYWLPEQRPTKRAGDGATRATAKVKSKAKARVTTPRA